MTEAPLVSVLMTAYNREKYIEEAIISVLDSSYINFELIIVDDCSTDSTVSIAKKYQQKDTRIKLYVNEKNIKQFPNRNKAISYASGEYIMHVDSDDTLLPDGIANVIKTMKSFPDSSFGMYYQIKKNIPPFEMDGKKAIRKHFFEQPFLVIGPGGTVLKRKFLNEIGGYTVDYEAAGDMYFNLKVCCYSSIVLLPFDFFVYRVHGEQELNNPYSFVYNSYFYLRDAMEKLPLGLSEKECKWFIKKNKRRLFVNVIRYFFTTFNVKESSSLLRKTKFTFKQMLEAIFQK